MPRKRTFRFYLKKSVFVDQGKDFGRDGWPKVPARALDKILALESPRNFSEQLYAFHHKTENSAHTVPSIYLLAVTYWRVGGQTRDGKLERTTRYAPVKALHVFSEFGGHDVRVFGSHYRYR